jgi:hypothetical protein
MCTEYTQLALIPACFLHTFTQVSGWHLPYVVLLEGLSDHMRDYINHTFKGEESYIGAIQIIGANSIQWNFYKRYLSPHYRYVDKELRIFYTMGEEDTRDDDLEMKWKQFPFQAVLRSLQRIYYYALETLIHNSNPYYTQRLKLFIPFKPLKKFLR